MSYKLLTYASPVLNNWLLSNLSNKALELSKKLKISSKHIFKTVNVLPVLPKPQNGSGIRAGTPLSSAEDKEMKKKLRNRESALAARERKKQKMLELEKKVTELGRENNALKVENCTLRGTLSTVMRKLVNFYNVTS